MKRSFCYFVVLLFGLSVGLVACRGERTVQVEAMPDDFVADLETGRALYNQACAGCHGPDARGLPGFSTDMTHSEFIAASTDMELVKFLKVGRNARHPENKTGVAMPPKGGFPQLTDQDLYHLVAYIRTLQE